jgi:hypothetical protein
LPPKKFEPAPVPPAVAAREPATLPSAAIAPAQPNRVEKPAPTIGNALPPKPEPPKAPQPSTQAALERDDPALACGRDELRLARLRSNPVPDEIARFQRELSCNRLHLQVQRLFESVAAAPPASAPPIERAGPAEPIPKPEPEVRPQAQAPPPTQPAGPCARDAERLARLRADPTVDAIARFEKELGCEQMRPQLRRLRESVGQ